MAECAARRITIGDAEAGQTTLMKVATTMITHECISCNYMHACSSTLNRSQRNCNARNAYHLKIKHFFNVILL